MAIGPPLAAVAEAMAAGAATAPVPTSNDERRAAADGVMLLIKPSRPAAPRPSITAWPEGRGCDSTVRPEKILDHRRTL